jgi:hypothetical protein
MANVIASSAAIRVFIVFLQSSGVQPEFYRTPMAGDGSGLSWFRDVSRVVLFQV